MSKIVFLMNKKTQLNTDIFLDGKKIDFSLAYDINDTADIIVKQKKRNFDANNIKGIIRALLSRSGYIDFIDIVPPYYVTADVKVKVYDDAKIFIKLKNGYNNKIKISIKNGSILSHLSYEQLEKQQYAVFKGIFGWLISFYNIPLIALAVLCGKYLLFLLPMIIIVLIPTIDLIRIYIKANHIGQ